MNAPSADAPAGVDRRRLRSAVLIPIAFWAAGMIVAHHPMIFSGFRLLQQDRFDSRFLHYMLEHGYRWISGDAQHRTFWDPPIFHPARNVAAYSETMLGTGPIYWAWRGLGFPPDLSYGLWLLAVSSLNFFAAFLFFRRILKRSPTASGYGAFLFSFASMRLANLGHPQLFPGFYLVAVLFCLARVIEQPDRRRAAPWVASLAAFFILQVYACFYLAWFLTLALGLALVAALALPSLRPGTLGWLRRQAPLLAGGLCLAGLALIPFVQHSLRAAGSTGYREYDEVEMFLPRVASWFYFSPDHHLYGRFLPAALYDHLPIRSLEQIALGLVSPILAGIGLWRIRTTPWGKLLGIVSVTLIVMTLCLPGGASFWGLCYLVLPGARAIRAVGRVAFLLLLPLSAGAATFCDEQRGRKSLLVAALLVSMLEQVRSLPALDRFDARATTSSISRLMDPSAEAVFVTCRKPLDAPSFLDSLPPRWHLEVMTASLEAGIPTINGYSGWWPTDWPFAGTVVVADAASEAEVERLLREWCRKQGIDRTRIQWIRDFR